jgi:hypothetical protein
MRRISISIAHLNNPIGDIGERFGDHTVILKLVDQVGSNEVAWNVNPVRFWVAV